MNRIAKREKKARSSGDEVDALACISSVK